MSMIDDYDELLDKYNALKAALAAAEWEVYRPLEEGEITRPGDQVLLPDENAAWEDVKGSREVPSPLYPAHCHYRRNRVKELEAALAAKEAELAKARDKITSLLSLVDGAKSIVEIYKAHSPAQIRWKSDWLNKAREALK